MSSLLWSHRSAIAKRILKKVLFLFLFYFLIPFGMYYDFSMTPYQRAEHSAVHCVAVSGL